MKRAHYLQHVPFEGLASIQSWLDEAGYEITKTCLFQEANLPNPNDFDLLIVMGGPMSVNDETQFPWLVAEKRFVRRAIEAEKAVLGICLGAQLIASAVGARVYRNPEPEIGWFPVRAADSGDTQTFRFPPLLEVFHWHGQTFDLPARALRLASSEGCQNQAFQLGSSVIGLQFHLETTPQSAEQLVAHCRAELVASKYVQPEAVILSAPVDKYRAINDLMGRVLAWLTRLG